MSYGIPERAVLIALMTLHGEIANSELKKRFNLSLDRPKRDKLNNDGLITSRKKKGHGSAWFHTLTDKGWKWLDSEMDSEVPPRAGSSAAGALYAVLNSLKPILKQRNLTPRQFFETQSDVQHSEVPKSADVSGQVKKAYTKLANGSSGSWVELVDLRKELADIPRKRLDQTILELYHDRKLNLTLHDQQYNINEAQRKSALRLGVDDMHLLAFR